MSGKTIFLFPFSPKINTLLLIEINHIISMYRLSYIINVRKLNIVLPFVVGGLACVILLKYSVYNTLYDYVYAMIYPLLFVLGFIWKIDWRVLKSL